MGSIAGAIECDNHLFPISREHGCVYCVRFLKEAPAASELSKEARLEELERWLTAERSVPENMLFDRVEAEYRTHDVPLALLLMDRCDVLLSARLAAEARSNAHHDGTSSAHLVQVDIAATKRKGPQRGPCNVERRTNFRRFARSGAAAAHPTRTSPA